MKEKDPILSDLCSRFVNRRLFQYSNLNPEEEPERFNRLKELFIQMGIDPEYYLYYDCTSDLPYDFYRPGKESTRLPIFLLMPNGEIRELSQESLIVDAIAGRIKSDHKVYFPKEILYDESIDASLRSELYKLIE